MIFSYEHHRLFFNEAGPSHYESADAPKEKIPLTPEQRAEQAQDTLKTGEKLRTLQGVSSEIQDQANQESADLERQILQTESSKIFENLLKPQLQEILKRETNRFENPQLQQAFERTQNNFHEFLQGTKLDEAQRMILWGEIKPIFEQLVGNSKDPAEQTRRLSLAAKFLDSIKQPLDQQITASIDWWSVSDSELHNEVLDIIYRGDTGNEWVNQERDRILVGNESRLLGKVPAREALRVAMTEYEQRNQEGGKQLFETFGLKPVDLFKAPSEFQQFLNNAEHTINKAFSDGEEIAQTDYLNKTVEYYMNEGGELTENQKLMLAVPNGIGAILKMPVSLPVAIAKIKPLADKMSVSEQRDEMFTQISEAIEKYWEESSGKEKTALAIELGTSFVFFGAIIKSLKSPQIADDLGKAVDEAAQAKEAAKGTAAEKGAEGINNTEIQKAITEIAEQTSGLQPLQPFQGLERIYEAASKMKPQFDKRLTDFSKEFGVDVKVTALKGEQRALEKVAKFTEPPNIPERLTDILRGSLVGEDMKQIYPAVEAFMKRFDVVQIKDRFSKPFGDGYRDLLMNVRLENGLIAEVQFQLKPILEYTDKVGHKLYELNRAIITEYRTINKKLAQGKTVTEKELKLFDEFNAREKLQINNYNKIWEDANR